MKDIQSIDNRQANNVICIIILWHYALIKTPVTIENYILLL